LLKHPICSSFGVWIGEQERNKVHRDSGSLTGCLSKISRMLAMLCFSVSCAPRNTPSKETYLGTGAFIVEKFVIASLAQKMLPDEKLGR
jgi:hypothetical protein